ncbi:NADH-ubiquinone oxidoreductase subunit 9 [Lelliottia jeotgali]|nr:NADH-ubiquinone oxidoreductase subunit 9 [Lelliottia jeotgali]
MHREAGTELVTVEENITGFFQSVIIREVDIVEISGNRCTLSIELKVGGLYGVLFHVSYSSDRQWHDLNDVRPMVQISTEIG